MSNAEEIAERAMQAGQLQSWSELSSGEIKQKIAKEIDEHTNATLQELKERVGKKVKSLEDNPVITDQNQMLSTYKDVITLIEDMQDE